jgi:hypothetical protein
MRRHISLAAIPAWLCLTACPLSGGQGTARISLAVLQDSNVFESDSAAASDQIARIWTELGGRCRLAGRTAVSADYSGGADVYSGHPSETRYVHAAGISAETGFRRVFSSGAELRGRTKTFMRDGRGYTTWMASPFIRGNLFGRAVLRLGWSAGGFDYTPSSAFDFRSSEWSAAVESSPLPAVKWSLRACSRLLDFERRAVERAGPDAPEREWRYLKTRQRDRVLEAAASVEAYWGALWVCRFSVQKNRSNSYGYSFRDPLFEVGFGKMLPWGLNVRAFWTHREKTYADGLADLIRIRPDAEDETNSQALLDLSRRFGGGWTARMRAARYRNESPIRALYYRKTIASLGLTREW